jgi:FKBP-type peptidyl-prolyl cis-trans isomerase
MRLLLAVVIGTVITVVVSAQEADQTIDETGYGVGFLVGEEIRTGLRRDGVGVDPDLLARGFRDGLTGGDPLVSVEEMERILMLLHQEMQDRMVRRLLEESPEFKKAHDENLAKSRQFHEIFGKQDGVVTLASGVQYKILRPGSGRSPVATSVVVLSGRVTLLDGTVISEALGGETRVADVIEGGIEALQLMKVGSKWQVVVPPALAHGPGGQMPLIGPNQTIVGVVELVAIK